MGPEEPWAGGQEAWVLISAAATHLGAFSCLGCRLQKGSGKGALDGLQVSFLLSGGGSLEEGFLEEMGREAEVLGIGME